MIKSINIKPGDVMPLSRRLSVCPDPLALYASLTDNGNRPDTLLLESADISTRSGERSLLLLQSALRATGRGRTVEIRPLSPNGLSALPWLVRELRKSAEVDFQPDSVTVKVPAPQGEMSESERLVVPSPLDAVRKLVTSWSLTARPAPLTLLTAGVLAYDLIDVFETLPSPKRDVLQYPDFVFWLPERLVIIDHRERQTTLISLVFGGAQAETAYADAMAAIEDLTASCNIKGTSPLCPAEIKGTSPLSAEVDWSDDDYAAQVDRLKGHIHRGDVFQIVPSRTFSMPCRDPLGAYTRLRSLNPSPYMFYVKRKEDTLFGASPETCVKVSGSPLKVEIRPIAGTRPRGVQADGTVDGDLDSRYEAELRLNEKELAEHMMLVDLARNDVARVSEPGTRKVDRLLTVDRYSHVMHLVSYVTGQLRGGLDALHAYTASMNMGTLVGAPKIRAAEILRETEATKRGPYGGAIGYLTSDGQMDTAIIIRSALVRDGKASVRAGAGIVYDSDPQAEADETRRKAAAVLKAIRG